MFRFMGATVFEIAWGSVRPPALVKGVSTERLGKGRVNNSKYIAPYAVCKLAQKISVAVRIFFLFCLQLRNYARLLGCKSPKTSLFYNDQKENLCTSAKVVQGK